MISAGSRPSRCGVEADHRIGDQHRHPGKPEPGGPADRIGEGGAEELAEDRARVDPHVEDREAGVAPTVALLVEFADHRRDVGLEEAVTDRDERQRDQQHHQHERIVLRLLAEMAGGDTVRLLPVGGEQRQAAVAIAAHCQLLAAVDQMARLVGIAGRRVAEILDHHLIALAVDHLIGFGRRSAEGEREIAHRHHQRAKAHRAFRAEILVGEQPSDQGGEVHQRGIAAVEPGRGAVAEHEMLGEIERQQRPHPVIAEPLPHLGAEQPEQRPGVAEPRSLRRRIDMGDVRLARAVRGRGVHHLRLSSLKSRCNGN